MKTTRKFIFPRWWGQFVSYLILLLGAVFMVGPFIWMIVTSIKPSKEIFAPNFFPVAPTLENYTAVFQKSAVRVLVHEQPDRGNHRYPERGFFRLADRLCPGQI